MKLRKIIHRLIFAAESHQLAELRENNCLLLERFSQADHKLSEALAQLEKLRPRPPRFDRYRAMDDDQLAEVLAGSGGLPAVKAIMQMIDEKFQQANDAASDPKLDDRETKFNLGGADWMVRLKGELQAALEQERAKEPAASR